MSEADDPDGTAVVDQTEAGIDDRGERLGSPDHFEVDFAFAAAVTDRGRRHHRNEDAFSLATGAQGRAVMAVCDGVSSSANPHRASAAAASGAVDVLAPLLECAPAGDDAVAEALVRAVARANASVADVDHVEPQGYPGAPSTTIVVAVVDPGRVAVGSIGDSRAYFLTADPAASTRLTRDDSLAEVAISHGVPADRAYNSPQAHVITRWLGDNEGGGGEPTVAFFTPDRSGVLVVCTDGLWNYFEAPDELAPIAAGAGERPIDVARALVRSAVEAGGSDNVTVAAVEIRGPGA